MNKTDACEVCETTIEEKDGSYWLNVGNVGINQTIIMCQSCKDDFDNRFKTRETIK